LKITYKGEAIEFREDMGEWRWESFSDVSIKKIKEKIDRAQSATFKRFTAWHDGGGWRGGGFERVTITSVVDNQYWITNEKKERQRVRLGQLYADTEENVAVITQIENLRAERGRIEKEIDELSAKLTKIEQPS